MKECSNDLSHQVRVEGINYEGFGIIPKCVMMDRDLSAQSKAIYAYFASFAGGNDEHNWFPSLNNALKYLGISETTYYNHYNPLKEQGYIKAVQESVNGRLVRNIYTLVDKPDKYFKKPSNPALAGVYAAVREEGICVNGYGTMPKAVAKDSRLGIMAKALYAFFASFAGESGKAFPERDDTTHFLCISHPTYGKYVNELLKYNYITATERNENGQFCTKVYTLNANPDETIVVAPKEPTRRVAVKINHGQKPMVKNQKSTETPKNQHITAEKPEKEADSHRSQKTREQKTGEQKTGEQKTREPINKQWGNKQSSNNQSIYPALAQGEDGSEKNKKAEAETPDPMKAELLKWLNSCTTKDTPQHMKVSNLFYFAFFNIFSKPDVRRKLQEYMMPDGISPVLGKIREIVNEKFIAVSQQGGIKYNPVGYMETCIWNALQLGEIGIPIAETSHHTSYDLDEFDQMMQDELEADIAMMAAAKLAAS